MTFREDKAEYNPIESMLLRPVFSKATRPILMKLGIYIALVVDCFFSDQNFLFLKKFIFQKFSNFRNDFSEINQNLLKLSTIHDHLHSRTKKNY